MSVGSPWNLQISQANIFDKSAAVFSFNGMKCAILVNLSMTTHNWSQPSDTGSSVMKSIAMDCQGA